RCSPSCRGPAPSPALPPISKAGRPQARISTDARPDAGPRRPSMSAALLASHSAAALSLLIATSFIASLARGFSGFGGALIFVPVASAAVGPQAAAPILLVIDGIAQLALLKNAWREANRREVAIMAVGALVGIPLGAAILRFVDPTLLRWAIAV